MMQLRTPRTTLFPTRRSSDLRKMDLSPQLTAKFEKLQTSYPVKRSALIPMLMYAQDEYGYVSDEMIAELGRRLDLNNVQIDRKSTRLNSSHRCISYAVFCLKK